jgi:hypothetical protein
MIDTKSFQKLTNKCSHTHRTIYRAKLKFDQLGNLTNQDYFVLYYPKGEKNYIVTVCGNVGQAEELKAVGNRVRDALQNNKQYSFGAMTFEHGVSDSYSEAFGIGRTGRSNANDTSYGLSIGDSLNRRMGKNQPSLRKIYEEHNRTIFSENGTVNFSGVILEDFFNNYVKLGEERTEELYINEMEKIITKAARKKRNKVTSKKYDKLSVAQKEKKVDATCYQATCTKLNNIEFSKNVFFDRDIFPIYKENYKTAHDLYRKKVERYGRELGVKTTQTSTCFFLDLLLVKARHNLLVEYKSIEYQQPVGSNKKLPCPIENGKQQLQRQMDLCEVVELICKQAESEWPNDEPLQKILKQRKTDLSFINENFSKRAKTNLDMAKKVDKNSFKVYKKKPKNLSNLRRTSKKSETESSSDQSDNETTKTESSSDQTGWDEESILDLNLYALPLEEQLTLFNKQCKESENNLDLSSKGQTDYGFITLENKYFNAQETHDYLFRKEKINLSNGVGITQSCKSTCFVNPFSDKDSFNFAQASEMVTPAAKRATATN